MSSADELPETLPRWEIPSDWKWVSIADVGKVITGNTPPTKDESNYGNFIPFVKPPALTDNGIRSTSEGLSETGVRSSRTLPAGAVLVSCIGGLGKTGIAKVPMAFNQQINAIVFDQRVVPEFGFYYAQTLKPWLHGVASATTLPIVNKGKFQRAPFPLAPLDQQKRIVAEIEKQFSRLDEAVANLKRVKANLKRYNASVLQSVTSGRLTTSVGRTANTTHWRWLTIAELASPEPRSIQSGPFGSNLRHSEFQVTGKLVIGIDNVRDGEFSLGSNHRISDAKFQELAKYSARPGDVLITVMATIGRVCVVPESIEPAIITKHVYRITVDRQLALPDYVAIALRGSYEVREQLMASVQGQTRPGLNGGLIKKIRVPLPPLEEQQRIVADVDRRLSLLRKTEAQVDANIKRAERLRQSILSRAFTSPRCESILL